MYFGILSAVISIAGFIPYIFSTLRGKTKPQRASWWIWSILMVIVLLAQIQQGVSWPILLTATYLLVDVVIAFLSVHRGYGRFEAIDLAAVCVAVVAVALWVFADNPTVALLIVIAIDLLGSVLTYQKTWHAPKTESLMAWTLLTIGAIFAVVSVGNVHSVKVVFPAYAVLVNAIMPFIIITRRRLKYHKGKK